MEVGNISSLGDFSSQQDRVCRRKNPSFCQDIELISRPMLPF